jgi:hypothetical protein
MNAPRKWQMSSGSRQDSGISILPPHVIVNMNVDNTNYVG